MSYRTIACLCLPLLLASSLPAQVPADLALVDIGATATTVLAMRHAGDGSGRLFLVERNGTINIITPGAPLLGGPFLDIEADVDTFFEGGLLGLAFHPDYATNGHFYVSYTRDGAGGDDLETVIERFTVLAGDPNQADLGSRVEIFTLGQPAGNHNGGDIHFGPDGFLYIGIGDGGGNSGTAQDNENLLGKMLRIDPCDDAGCSPTYIIPLDNPFVGLPGADEIWATGLRNPYRWSFDRETGDLFIADVGANAREEVNFQLAASAGGEDYGWNCREGDIAGPGGCGGTFVEPVMVYDQSAGDCAISGGYRYRGCIQGLQGVYVFGDFCTSRVWFAEEGAPGSFTFFEWDDLGGSVFGFGEDEDGEVYLSQGGTVFRFESASDCVDNEIFSDGFESGDTSVWDGVVPLN